MSRSRRPQRPRAHRLSSSLTTCSTTGRPGRPVVVFGRCQGACPSGTRGECHLAGTHAGFRSRVAGTRLGTRTRWISRSKDQGGSAPRVPSGTRGECHLAGSPRYGQPHLARSGGRTQDTGMPERAACGGRRCSRCEGDRPSGFPPVAGAHLESRSCHVESDASRAGSRHSSRARRGRPSSSSAFERSAAGPAPPPTPPPRFEVTHGVNRHHKTPHPSGDGAPPQAGAPSSFSGRRRRISNSQLRPS